MGINSVNQQFRGFGRVSDFIIDEAIVAPIEVPYYENPTYIAIQEQEQAQQVQSTLNASMAGEDIRLAEIAVRDRLGISFENWAKLVAKYKEMTNKKYILDYGVAGTVFSSTMDRTLYFDHVEIEAAIKSIREQLAKDATANAPQTPQVPIPQPLPAPLPIEAFSSFSLDAESTAPLPKTLPNEVDTKSKTLLYAGIGLGVAALCGGAYWYFSK